MASILRQETSKLAKNSQSTMELWKAGVPERPEFGRHRWPMYGGTLELLQDQPRNRAIDLLILLI